MDETAPEDARIEGGALQLDSLQCGALVPQVDEFIAAATDPGSRSAYQALREAVEQMEVPAELAPRLIAIVELALSSGRVRRQFGPGAELALFTLYQKTPRGRKLGVALQSLNGALAQLKGQSIEQVSAVLRGPGAYAITLKTSGCQIVIRLEQEGVRVESLEVALD